MAGSWPDFNQGFGQSSNYTSQGLFFKESKVEILFQGWSLVSTPEFNVKLSGSLYSF